MTNANIYLPLCNLTAFQTALLDPTTGRATAAATTPEMLAAGMGASTFMPRRTLADPEIAALAKCFAHNDGVRVLPDTIQYLHERAADETSWLEALSTSRRQHHVVWGLHDNIAPVRVANHVWQTYLKNKPGTNRYWIVPGRRSLPAVRRPRAIGADRAPDRPGRRHRAADARRPTRRRGAGGPYRAGHAVRHAGDIRARAHAGVRSACLPLTGDDGRRAHPRTLAVCARSALA